MPVPGVPRNCFGCHQLWVQKMTERTATVTKCTFSDICMMLPDSVQRPDVFAELDADGQAKYGAT
eukprot:361440-Chlamydomonas_euryale.AAC.6